MKNLVIIFGLCLFSSVFAQNLEKAFFENNPALGGDAIIQSASVKIVGEEIFKTFEIESFEDGRFYTANFRKGIYVISVNINGKSISQKVTI